MVQRSLVIHLAGTLFAVRKHVNCIEIIFYPIFLLESTQLQLADKEAKDKAEHDYQK